MKWLVTGGCGFIGSALITDLLAEGGHSVTVLDNLSVGTRDDLNRVAAFVERTNDGGASATPLDLVVGDIIDLEAITRACEGVDVVVHLAANTGVGPSVEDPMGDCRSNVMGTLNVLEACRAAGIKRFVFASSGAPLGVQVPPLHEGMAPRPASPYGASKLAGEGYCSAYYQCFGIETVTLRLGNVYGPGSGHKQSVVAKFIKMALSGETLEIYGDGQQTRDFIHISDLVRAIRSAATTPSIGGEIFQIATARETTVAELTQALMDAFRDAGIAASPVIYGAQRNGDVARNYSNTRKAQERLGWKAQVTLKDGLAQTLGAFVKMNSFKVNPERN